MHELVAWASEDVARLDMETRSEKMQQLHHPVLEADYFDELKRVWPAWQNRWRLRQLTEDTLLRRRQTRVRNFEALRGLAQTAGVFEPVPRVESVR